MTDQLHFFYGNDEYLVDTNAKKQVEKICPPAEQSLVLEIIDGSVDTIDATISAIDNCIAAFRTVGLFGGKKVVWFRNISFLKSLVIMKNARVKELLNTLAGDLKKGLAPDQFLVVSSSGVDKRSAFFKALKSAGKVEEYSIPERDYEAQPAALSRARSLFKERGYSIDPQALESFIEKTGFETRQIINEVEKMTLFKGEEDRTISLSDVQNITSTSSEAISWDFTDAVADQKLALAIRLFRQLIFQKQSAIGLIIQLENKFSDLLRFREFLQAGWVQMNGTRIQWSNNPEIDTYFSRMAEDPRKMHWFRASKLLAQAIPYSAVNLAARKKAVLDMHERMISEGSIPHDLLLETLIAKLCAPRRKK